LLAVSLVLATPQIAAASEWFVEAHYPDAATLARVAPEFQHLIIDAGKHTLRVDTDDEGIRLMQQAGMDVRIDMTATATMRAFYEPADSVSTIPGFACYRTVEETYTSIDDIVEVHPDLASAENIGPTWERTRSAANGYPMRALRVTNLRTIDKDPERPRMVMFGSIHAREYTPAELLTRMAEWLVTGYGTDAQATWLVDHVDFRFILQANPDGRKKAEAGVLWRKNTNTVDAACSGTVTSSRQPGVDLNRNFPFHWGVTNGQGSSTIKCEQTYRGPSAGSEPETRNLVAYVAGTPDENGIYTGGALPNLRPNNDINVAAPDDYPGVFFDIHSYSQLVVWPWGDTRNASLNATALQTFGRRLAWFNGYIPAQSSDPNYLYTTDGTTDDTFYGVLGAPSYTIELGTSFFESCTNFANSTLPKNLDALKYAARTAKAPYRLPAGPDAHALALSAQEVEVGTSVQISAVIDDSRYSAVNGIQTSHPIIAASAYIDSLPWEPGAIAIPLAATDGTFDSTTENVSGTIATVDLAPGRHLIYVQGTNNLGADGTPGAPDAIFLDIIPVNTDRIFTDGFDVEVP
jgi:hypothetical protein